MTQLESHSHQEAHKTWWQRNWKWFVPTGCFGLLVFVAVFVVIAYFSVSSRMKQAEPFIEGFKSALTNSHVQESLGKPIALDTLTEEDIVIEEDAQSADIYFPIKGPNGTGTIHVVGKKENEEWVYSEISIYLEPSKETIDLLEK